MSTIEIVGATIVVAAFVIIGRRLLPISFDKTIPPETTTPPDKP